MSISKNLFKIVKELIEYNKIAKLNDLDNITATMEIAEIIGKAWSGSWLGYQSRVYYKDFKIPPTGDYFSQEWGFDTASNWQEYNYDDVIELIYTQAGNLNFDDILEETKKAEEVFDDVKSSTLSLIHSNFEDIQDKFFQKIVTNIESLEILTEHEVLHYQQPSGQIMSRDATATEEGLNTPPHLAIIGKMNSLKLPFQACHDLEKNIIKLASHIQNLEKKAIKSESVGVNVFIGHGRSPYWRELKDFIDDRLSLSWDEFNRVPVAGVTNITRLAQMLDESCIAFLIMTAEDEQLDGNLHARMNVIHEVGLFQGKLGFEKAIVILEEGCEEFSNIEGLGQIRFPKGNISAIFEDIRQVLEREKIID